LTIAHFFLFHVKLNHTLELCVIQNSSVEEQFYTAGMGA